MRSSLAALVLVALPFVGGCDLLNGLIGPPCDPEADPNCPDETRGNIEGTVTIPQAGAAYAGPRTLSPDLRAMRRAIIAEHGLQSGTTRAPPSAPAVPSKRRAVAQRALDNIGTPKVRVEEFRRGEVIIGAEESVASTKAVWGQRIGDFLDDGTRARVHLCATKSTCLLKLDDAHGKPLDLVATAEAAARLDGMPGLRFAERNLVLQAQKVPNDEFYALQWHYGAIGLEPAWDFTTGSADVVASIIDTGCILNHPDLEDRVLDSADLIDDPEVANDGDGRDEDGDDVGDEACGSDCHSFHGTHVAGTMGASTNNGSMVSGVTWEGELICARSLGKGGGSLFDIASGIYWSIGSADVEGIEQNTTPAHVINMSLGGASEGSPAMDEAVDAAVAENVIVVVAAGNDNVDASGFTPANSPGAIAVASVGNVGGSRTQHRKASYSNFGNLVSVAGPGGEQAEDVDGDGQADGVLSTFEDYVVFYQGTSMAAPHVAGVAMLMKSVDQSLSPADARRILEETSNPNIDCDDGCGAGLIDAARAVREVQGGGDEPFVTASPASLRVGRGDTDASLVFKNIGGTSTAVTFLIGGPNRDAITLSTTEATLGSLEEVRVDVDIERTGDDEGEATVTAQFEGGQAEARVIWTADVVRTSNNVLVGAIKLGGETFNIERIVQTSNVDGYAYKLFNLDPGTYIVLGLTDDDGDGDFEANEGVGMYRTFPDAEELTVTANGTVDGIDFSVAPRFGEGEEPGGGGTGEGDIGAACGGSEDCLGGLYCETSLPGGYCTTDCNGDEDCTADSACFTLSSDGGEYQVCLATCTTPADCRTDGTYTCDVDGTCYPG